MGCFPVLKCKKKKSDQIMYLKRVSHKKHVPTVLPEPQTHTRSVQSAPPSFKTRVKPIYPINRTRALSAPSTLDVEEQDGVASVEYEEQEELKYRTGSIKEQRSSFPQPLPLPCQHCGGALKATGSFKTRMTSVPPYASRPAPDAAEQEALASVEYEEQEESKYRTRSLKERRSSYPQPLPLPSCQAGGAALKPIGSFKSRMAGGPLYASEPLPLPPTGSLRNFQYDEIAAACHNFSSDRCMSECLSSTIYKASFGDDASSARKFDATVTRLHSSIQGLREFINGVNTLASLQHPNLCKLLGYLSRDGSEPRMLVYERLWHGSLDNLLFGRTDGLSIDWNMRMKIAICAAQGLTFLHEEGPFQAMFNEFSTANIQIDKDFSAKLSGYGCCFGHIPDEDISSSSSAVGNLAVETLERGILTPKSNVWSFGIILLELLTGRKNIDSHHSREERNLVKWSRPFLADDFRLSLIMDPQLKGRFPTKAARAVADIAQRCLQKDPSERPTMRTIVEHFKMIQDMKYSCWFPLQEPAVMSAKHMSRSPSLNGIICHPPRLCFSPSPPSVARPTVSAPRLSGVPAPAPTMLLPLHACSSTLSLAELGRQESRKSSSSEYRRASLEGY